MNEELRLVSDLVSSDKVTASLVYKFFRTLTTLEEYQEIYGTRLPKMARELVHNAIDTLTDIERLQLLYHVAVHFANNEVEFTQEELEGVIPK